VGYVVVLLAVVPGGIREQVDVLGFNQGGVLLNGSGAEQGCRRSWRAPWSTTRPG
jgi:hypothetical protein